VLNKQPIKSFPTALIPRTKPQAFSRFFGLWAGIIGFPGLLFYFMGNQHLPIVVLLKQLLVCLAPALLFGAIGAAVMTFLVPPGRMVLALIVGILTGFVIPVATFWTVGAILPRNEATMGYFLAGWVFGMAGGAAGFFVGIWRGSQPRL